ncbi:MAG TPA: adenylosuccinate synthase [Candidatus Krumholzibacteria bacterium]|nr:adenylosuccinate synthase [Candidatus Krumholzibacteria bacterium]
MPVTLVVGGQWGDEGKAKIIDYLARGVDYVVRFQGGANAGHTVVVGDNRFAFHQVPSGILYPNATCVLGGGMVIDPAALVSEIADIAGRGVDVSGRILISNQAHLVLPYHILLDCDSEDRRVDGGIGTTRKGISPAYADKARRDGVRMADLCRPPAALRELVTARVRENNRLLKLRGAKTLSPGKVVDQLIESRKHLLPMITDTRPVLWDAVAAGKNVLCEGAQGSLLDIDHGTYPYVTSSSCSAGGAAIGTGLPPSSFDRIVGIFKAYCTRVGNGPFPTEEKGKVGQKLRDLGHEYGTTTGRPRRCGWFDAVAARTVVKINGVTDIALTKLDVLDTFAEVKVCTSYRVGKRTVEVFPADARDVAAVKPQYETIHGWETRTEGKALEELPPRAIAYIRRLEQLVGCRIHLVSLGPERSAMVEMPMVRGAAAGM